MTKSKPRPAPPTPPPTRVEYASPFGARMFNSRAEFDAWKALPFWKRAFK